MIKFIAISSFVIGLFASLLISVPVHAVGLKIAPLEYKTTLAKNEKKKGYIDVSNPTGQALTIKVSVQAFKQINDDGGLQFFDDARISRGIKPELTSIDMKPREAYRIYFGVDGAQLPEGDVYAAVFFSSNPKSPQNGVGQSVRVGTILSIINNTPGERKASIANVSMPFIQTDEKVKGTYVIRNDGTSNSGFYPEVELRSWPRGKVEKNSSSLLFSGRKRTNNFTYDSGYGFYKITVSYKNSQKSQWVLVVHPTITIISLLVLGIIALEFALLKRRRSHTKH